MRRSERRPNRVYTAVVVGSSPAGPTYVTVGLTSMAVGRRAVHLGVTLSLTMPGRGRSR